MTKPTRANGRFHYLALLPTVAVASLPLLAQEQALAQEPTLVLTNQVTTSANKQASNTSNEGLTEIIVTTANRAHVLHSQLIGNTDYFNEAIIETTNAEHLNQLLASSAGTWLSRGNGQESLLSIRSPVLTGPGSCAEFLTLQDGIALRASGFCNVNQLFDSHFEQASSVEVVKGVNSAHYGSNAIHGVININSPTYQAGKRVALEYGANDYRRVKALFSSDDNGKNQDDAFNLALTASKSGGFQDSSGYEQQKLSANYLHHINDWQIDHKFTLSHLNQQTAGFLQQGENSYRNRQLLRINEFPDAYRNSFSARYLSRISLQTENSQWQITPYLRSNHMDFLLHFLPGTPVEENGHDSIGLQVQYQRDLNEQLTLRSGVDLEATDGYLRQFQAEPTQTGSAFLNAVLPQGQQYDYDIQSENAAFYSSVDWQPNDKWRTNIALRFDTISYDYDNHLLDGNTRDDGTECGFGGCRYTRPADRQDNFNDWSYSLGVSYQVASSSLLYLNLDKGFRAPHTSELYRLQNGQQIADIDGVNARQAELGYRLTQHNILIEANAFYLIKTDGILQTSDREYINGLDTTHKGVELSANWQFDEQWQWLTNASWTEHKYDNNPSNGSDGVTLLEGNFVDTAPKLIASTSLNWQPNEQLSVNIQWQYLDDYFLNPQNTERYSGHDLTHLRLHYQISKQWKLSLRVNNLFDQRYAERADFAFGNHRYFVGLPRNSYVEASYQF